MDVSAAEVSVTAMTLPKLKIQLPSLVWNPRVVDTTWENLAPKMEIMHMIYRYAYERLADVQNLAPNWDGDNATTELGIFPNHIEPLVKTHGMSSKVDADAAMPAKFKRCYPKHVMLV